MVSFSCRKIFNFPPNHNFLPIRLFSKSKVVMANKFQPIKTFQPTGEHKGTIFFFHGAGDTGYGISEWVQGLTRDRFKLPHLKVVFPTAPKRPYTAHGGAVTNVWFDRYATSFSAPEHEETLEQTCKDLSELIKEEMEKNNLAKNQIIFGGFSMGGALALHLAYRYFPNIAGVFAMSSFLNKETKVYEVIEKTNSHCPIFMAHGKLDTLVDYDWGYGTFENLKKVGIGGEFRSFEGDHELNLKVVLNLHDWITQMIPKD